MRCLKCKFDGIKPTDENCPKCRIPIELANKNLLPPGTQLENGKYRIDYALGQGGFGITYQAIHTEFNRPVAIKEFFPFEGAFRSGQTVLISMSSPQQNYYGKALKRFIKEGQVLHDLRHPYVVRVRDLFRTNNTAYIVMDLIEGLTLREILDKRAGSWLHSDEVEQITEKLVSALSETHKLGVCHLDLSPDNVMLDAKGNPILIDFGAARQSLDMTHSFAFKPRYAPPELMFEGDVGPETDLFELSMMIYEMLTGKLPPSANQRLGMNGNDWTPTGVSEAWKSLLAVGLNLEQKDRPKDILYWWENFYKYSKNNSGRPKMIIGEIKPSKPKMVIGRRVSRHKP